MPVKLPKNKIKSVVDILNRNSVHYDDLGIIQDKNMSYKGDINLPIEELSDAHKYWLEEFMEK